MACTRKAGRKSGGDSVPARPAGSAAQGKGSFAGGKNLLLRAQQGGEYCSSCHHLPPSCVTSTVKSLNDSHIETVSLLAWHSSWHSSCPGERSHDCSASLLRALEPATWAESLCQPALRLTRPMVFFTASLQVNVQSQTLTCCRPLMYGPNRDCTLRLQQYAQVDWHMALVASAKTSCDLVQGIAQAGNTFVCSSLPAPLQASVVLSAAPQAACGLMQKLLIAYSACLSIFRAAFQPLHGSRSFVRDSKAIVASTRKPK